VLLGEKKSLPLKKLKPIYKIVIETTASNPTLNSFETFTQTLFSWINKPKKYRDQI
jgi:hypothetical protein